MKHAAHVPFRSMKSVILAVLFLCLLFGSRAMAQQPQTPDQAAWEAKQQREAAKQESIKRERDLKKDTEKLLELATELKQYVDKTNENTLSVGVIKKADEIEKLAHTVKEKMKGH
jgi:Ni/Co efflux regulator RcnB